jgi:hypothetical protein
MNNFVIQTAGYFCDYLPNSFHFKGEPSYENLIWETEDFEKPSEEQFLEKMEYFKQEYSRLEYQRLRALDYPDIKEYLDGVVKGDQNQINDYIAKCLAVKEKYPKPE